MAFIVEDQTGMWAERIPEYVKAEFLKILGWENGIPRRDGCIEWPNCQPDTYGWVMGWPAHRVAYAVGHPEYVDMMCGLVVHHNCEVKSCINYRHLDLHTYSSHMRWHRSK